jgi:hypothetical protein
MKNKRKSSANIFFRYINLLVWSIIFSGKNLLKYVNELSVLAFTIATSVIEKGNARCGINLFSHVFFISFFFFFLFLWKFVNKINRLFSVYLILIQWMLNLIQIFCLMIYFSKKIIPYFGILV